MTDIIEPGDVPRATTHRFLDVVRWLKEFEVRFLAHHEELHSNTNRKSTAAIIWRVALGDGASSRLSFQATNKPTSVRVTLESRDMRLLEFVKQYVLSEFESLIVWGKLKITFFYPIFFDAVA